MRIMKRQIFIILHQVGFIDDIDLLMTEQR